MYLREIWRKCWTTDEHDSCYILEWGRPSAWALGVEFELPHDSGGCYSHKRDAAGELQRVDYTHRSWHVQINLLWRSFFLVRVKQRPITRS